jgi:hypothetical protein
MSHMCHGQNLQLLGSSLHGAEISCHLDVVSPLFSRLSIAPGWCYPTLPICPTWNWTPDIVLILGTDIGVQTFCAVSGVQTFSGVRCVSVLTPAKPAVTVVVYGKPQAFWCLPSVQPRVIVYLMMDQDCMPSWEPWANGTNAYSAVVNSEWHKNKVISLTCVRSPCCFWTFFHLTLSHYIDSDWVPQNVVTSRHMLYFMTIMSIVSCWCYAFAFNAEGLLCEATHL